MFNKIKEKLIGWLGNLGIILYYIISILLIALPLVAIGLPWWVDFIFTGLMLFIPSTAIIFWIWGLVATILGPQDIIAIIYYVAFAIIFMPVILSIFKKNK